MSQHTPGPWSARIYGGWDTPRIWSDEGSIAMIQHHASSPAEGEANAKLIAAAPDLLASVKELLNCIDSNRDWEEAKRARAALTKVES